MGVSVYPESSVIFGLDFQARSLASLNANDDKSTFLIGTQSLKFPNQVYYVEFDDESNKITKQCINHDIGEIWHISTSQCRNDVFATCYQTVSSSNVCSGCKVWRLIHVEEEECNRINAEPVVDLNTNGYNYTTGFHWNPTIELKAFALCDSTILLIDLNGDLQIADSRKIDAVEKGVVRINSGRWDPHHDGTSLAVAYGTSVSGWDTRTLLKAYVVESAHLLGVRDLDFNPNRPYHMTTAGEDGQVSFWDLRKANERLHTFNHHSHWVWMVKYNPIHDQLLLSSSSDCKVALSCINSLSSEQLEKTDLKTPEDDEHTELSDGLIKLYAEHEDSAYCCEWSASDPWIFASLSYDGRFVVNRVPRQIKYNVLQL